MSLTLWKKIYEAHLVENLLTAFKLSFTLAYGGRQSCRTSTANVVWVLVFDTVLQFLANLHTNWIISRSHYLKM